MRGSFWWQQGRVRYSSHFTDTALWVTLPANDTALWVALPANDTALWVALRANDTALWVALPDRYSNVGRLVC